MKALKHVSLLLFLSFILVNCSKEKRLERSLHKRDGKWNVSNVTWQRTQIDTAGEHISLGTTANAGTFTFDKEGNGAYDFTIDGFQCTQAFKYSVTGDVITIRQSLVGSINSAFNPNVTISFGFQGTKTEKKEFSITGSQTNLYYMGNTESVVISGTFFLMR